MRSGKCRFSIGYKGDVMKEQMERIEIPFTYTYDQFTVFFHDDHVFIGERDVPVGQ